MKIRTALTNLTVLTFATALAACAAPAGDDDGAELDSATDSTAQALRISVGGSSVKSTSELEGEGYTCRQWAGTTITECTKLGSPTYTCDSPSRCTVLKTTEPTPPPIVVGPISTAFLSP